MNFAKAEFEIELVIDESESLYLYAILSVPETGSQKEANKLKSDKQVSW